MTIAATRHALGSARPARIHRHEPVPQPVVLIVPPCSARRRAIPCWLTRATCWCFRGTDYTTTVAAAVIGLLVAALVVGVLWKLLTLPFRAWRQRRPQRQGPAGKAWIARGHYVRAEQLLARAPTKATTPPSPASRPRVPRAAMRLPRRRTSMRSIRSMPAPAPSRWPNRHGRRTPGRRVGRARRARGAAVAAAGQALRAGARRQRANPPRPTAARRRAAPAARVARCPAREAQQRWGAAALREAADANALADTWDRLPKELRNDAGVVAAYADRAVVALRWDDAALKAMEQALDARWDETLAARYGTLPMNGRVEQRRANLERLQAHPSSPALLLGLARLDRGEGRWPQAEANLHRALAQGAGAEAWEEFSNAYAQAGDADRAQRSYANALRVARARRRRNCPGATCASRSRPAPRSRSATNTGFRGCAAEHGDAAALARSARPARATRGFSHWFRYSLHARDFHPLREGGIERAAQLLHGEAAVRATRRARRVDRGSGFDGRIAGVFVPRRRDRGGRRACSSPTCRKPTSRAPTASAIGQQSMPRRSGRCEGRSCVRASLVTAICVPQSTRKPRGER